MIYEFRVSTLAKPKTILLTADSKSAFFRRIAEMYGLTKEEVVLVREYKETEDFGYELHKSYIKEMPAKKKNNASHVLIDKALKEFNAGHERSKRMVEPRKSDYIQRHKLQSTYIESVDDVADLMTKYKMVKVYWENGDRRGSHQLYCVYK